MNQLKKVNHWKLTMIMIVSVCLIMTGLSAQTSYGLNKLPSDIYREINGKFVPFPEQTAITYGGDHDLNEQLGLDEAQTNSGEPITYTSSNTGVAEVNSKGYVTARKAGTTVITMKARESEEYLEASATMALTMEKGDRFITGTKSYSKKVGDKSYTLEVAADDMGTMQYKSSNTKVATVSQSGKVTVKAPGVTTITVTAVGTDLYNAAILKTSVTVRPKAAAIKGAASAKEGALKVSWSKMSGVSGYQVVCAKDKAFKTGKHVKTAKSTATSLTFTGLAKGEGYYAKVRAYKVIGGKNYYGEYSNIKSCTVKGEKAIDPREYYGWYEKFYGETAESDLSRFLHITKIANGKITFYIEQYGINGSPIYDTNHITAKLKNKRATFKWKDSWFNSGTGSLIIGTKQVKYKMKQTKTSNSNRSSLDTGGKYVTLKKQNKN